MKGRRQTFWLRVTVAVVLCSLVVLVAGTTHFAREVEEIKADSQRQLELSVRLRKLQAVLVTLGDAETGQRGYLLTGKPQYLGPYTVSVALMPNLLASLDGIPLRLSDPRPQAASIRRLVRLKFDELSETIRLHDAGRHADAMTIVQSDAGQRYMDQARAEIVQLLAQIRGERDAMTRAVAEKNAATRRVALATVSVLAIGLVLTFVQMMMLSRARARSESQLADSEQRHRSIVEQQTEMISIAQEDGTLLYVNPAYGRHFHKVPEALVGTNLYDMVDPADLPAVRRHIEAVLAGAVLPDAENRMIEPDGREVWISWKNQLRSGPHGERQLHSVGRDITERKRVEIALRLSENLLHRMGRLAGVGGWEFDKERGVLTWSEEIRRIHEVGEDHVPTVATGIAFYSAESQPRVQAAFSACWADGEPFDLEAELITARGRTLCVHVVGEAEFNEEGRPIRLVGAMQDITARKDAERRMHQLTATLRAVIEAIPAMVAVFDARGRYAMVNRAFERWRGLTRDGVVGHSVASLLGPEEFERNRPWFERALQGETVSYELDDRHDGQPRHVHVTCIPMWHEDGSVDGFVTVSQDVTDHREETRRLVDLSERDALTGLLNRAGYTRYLTEACAGDGAASVALLYIDLDHFKPVNDTHGHAAGDELLRQFAQRLQRLVRPTDAIARLGGDEFAVVLTNVREQAHAEIVADKVVSAGGEPFDIGGVWVRIGASVGVAFDAGGEGGWQALTERADANVYRAKAAGRGQRA